MFEILNEIEFSIPVKGRYIYHFKFHHLLSQNKGLSDSLLIYVFSSSGQSF